MIHNVFPANNETVAYYDGFGQFIKLCKVKQGEFEGYKRTREISEDSNVMWSVYAHELTHWLDHTTSLWGQQNLVLLYNALNVRVLNKAEEFWRIKYYLDSCRSDELESYYTQIHRPDLLLDRNNWTIEKYAGSRFNLEGRSNHAKPIFYLEFVTDNDIQIARIPITVAALLECRATHNEYNLRRDTINSFYSEESIGRGRAALNQNFEDTIYNPSLILYSVIGYLTMFTCDMNDLGKVYELSSIVANISLNFPHALTSCIKKIDRSDPELKKNYDLLIKNRDPGFIYNTLIQNMAGIEIGKDISVDEILDRSNLPREDEFKRHVVLEMEENMKTLVQGPFTNQTEKLLRKGVSVFNAISLSSTITDLIPHADDIMNPKLIYKDTLIDTDKIVGTQSAVSLIEKEGKTFEEYYVIFLSMRDQFNEFEGACGI